MTRDDPYQGQLQTRNTNACSRNSLSQLNLLPSLENDQIFDQSALTSGIGYKPQGGRRQSKVLISKDRNFKDNKNQIARKSTETSYSSSHSQSQVWQIRPTQIREAKLLEQRNNEASFQVESKGQFDIAV